MQTRRNNYRSSRFKKRTVSRNIKSSEKILSVFLVLLICVIGLLYMFKTVSIATNGYDVECFEKQLDDIRRENQKMIIELADLKAIYNLESESSNLVAVENDNIKYITSSLGVVAMER